jgi:hypothetical protein
MIDAEFNREDIRVLIQTGGTNYWYDYDIPSALVGRYLVDDYGIEELEMLSSRSMGESQTLTDFIDFGMTYFPADRYGLVLWNHGGGSVEGFGVDEWYDYDGLTLAEMDTAMRNSEAAQQKLAFVGFDACLMASAETAWVFRDYADYLIGSEELEPGYGWDYYEMLSALGNDPEMSTLDLGVVTCESFVDYYVDNDMAEELTTLSVIDLSKIDAVIEALDNFTAVANLSDYGFQSIAKPRSRAHEFGMPSEYGYSYDMVDIVNLATQYQDLFPAQVQQLIDATEQAVVYNNYGPYVSNANGLSIFFPFSQQDEAAGRVESYKSTGFSSEYINYLAEFTNVLTGTTIAPFTPEEIAEIVPEEIAETPSAELPEGDDGYDIYLTQEQIDNIQTIYFTAWFHEGDDIYTQIYQDSFVEIDYNGRILTEYDGIITTINDEWACLYEIETGENYVRYAVPAVLNGQDVNLILLYEDGADPKVLGAMPDHSESHGMAPKQMIKIKDGDEITLVYYAEQFYDIDDDSDAEAEAFFYEGDPFTVDGSLLVEDWYVYEGEFMYGFVIIDLQGNEYYTDFIVVEFYEE